jgi:hypothetical protein
MLRIGCGRQMGLAFLALGAVLVLGNGPAPAQDGKIYVKKNTFKMPIEIDDAMRDQLKEVRLYVKAGNADWVQQETADPKVRFFNYRVNQDGEYWFSVATVDKNNKMTPADLNKEPPGLRVVVDTVPPSLDLKAWTAPDGETCLLCTMQDANPDLQSIRITFQGSDGVEHALEPHSFKAGLFRVPAELWGSKVRVSAEDKCHNKVIRDVQLTTSASPPSFLSQAVTGAPVPPVQPGNVKVTQNPVPSSNVMPSPAPVNPVLDKVASGPGPVAMAPSRLPDGPPALSEVSPNMQSKKPAIRSFSPPATAGRQLLNTTHASMDYRIDQVGPSGIGKVEVWMTADQGQSWQRLNEDTDRHSPADIDLPGDGLFGLRLVVTNGNGFGGSPPIRGDQPAAWIEVDTTAPFVQLRDVDPITDGGSLTIHWSAKDKNLNAEPISLFYRTKSDGPWQVVARGLKNDGSYRWSFPHNVGSQFFFKVEAADQAGNIGMAESANPVVLDMTEPHAFVLGITGIRPRTP